MAKWRVALPAVLVIAIGVFLVIAVVVHKRHFWSPLTPDEIMRVGAVLAAGQNCNIVTVTTWKADELGGRIRASWKARPEQQEAIAKAKERFNKISCDELLVRFPDMIKPVYD